MLKAITVWGVLTTSKKMNGQENVKIEIRV